jgi:hypothetical protein
VIGLLYLALFAFLVVSKRPLFVAGAALAESFALFQLLPGRRDHMANHLAFFVPAALVLVLLGATRNERTEIVSAWGFYAAAIVVALLASVFSVWPDPKSLAEPRIVLLAATAAWVALLFRTRREAFVYLASLTLALLVYNFVQTSADVFTRHVVAFFIGGMLVLGLIFLAAGSRRWVTFRSPTLTREPKQWYRRMAYVLPVTFIAIVTFGSWGVTQSSTRTSAAPVTTCRDTRRTGRDRRTRRRPSDATPATTSRASAGSSRRRSREPPSSSRC